MSSQMSQKEKLFFLLFTLVFFCLSVLIVNTVTQVFVAKEINYKKEEIKGHLALVRSNIEAIIFKDTYLADSLATVVTLDPAFAIKNWSMIAGKLVQKAQYVRNVGLAPDNIISHIYPVAGNESAIGFDFRTKPEQLKTVLLAKELQGVYIAGPLELVQGGVAIIARYPIFSDYPTNLDYWGTVSVVIDYDKLLDKSGIKYFKGASISLRKHAENLTNAGKIFYGDADNFKQPDVEYPINLPNGKWELGAKVDMKSIGNMMLTQRILNSLGGLTAILAYISIILLYRNYKYAHTAALHDELTHLPNRRFMMNLLGRTVTKGDDKALFTLLNVDLNDFKRVNDELGHEAGDELLRHVARQLKEHIRATDIVARIGGDEFIVILEGITDEAMAAHVIQKLRYQVEASALTWAGKQLHPSLSIGRAIYAGQKITVKQLLSEADQAMYAEKQKRKHADWVI
ncbi:sensor domain-containing diguanylate cyclase [Shewanella yunxiaonensis]|uniref:Sensor domain-containing diguanylate cyclase n=1 Tax=Shewanella yunxiaonensis TaxID=2829809 RepID=A0ABX7YS69_9GAMM|nr:diguanylate cyclase [Shewanella yunxiaonensis]QUN05225.1 sensor domain-containing diguanylate cyclase [Shewanella yunxiaonensis]